MSSFQNCLVLMPKAEVAIETWHPNGKDVGSVCEIATTVRRAGSDVLVDIEVADANGTTTRKQIVVLAAEGK